MMDFDNFGTNLPSAPLSRAEKAAAVLLAMGTPVAGKLLKYFTQSELQVIISSAQTAMDAISSRALSMVHGFRCSSVLSW